MQGVCEQLRSQLRASEDKCRQLQFALLDGQALSPLTSPSCCVSRGTQLSAIFSPAQHVTTAENDLDSTAEAPIRSCSEPALVLSEIEDAAVTTSAAVHHSKNGERQAFLAVADDVSSMNRLVQHDPAALAGKLELREAATLPDAQHEQSAASSTTSSSVVRPPSAHALVAAL